MMKSVASVNCGGRKAAGSMETATNVALAILHRDIKGDETLKRGNWEPIVLALFVVLGVTILAQICRAC